MCYLKYYFYFAGPTCTYFIGTIKHVFGNCAKIKYRNRKWLTVPKISFKFYSRHLNSHDGRNLL